MTFEAKLKLTISIYRGAKEMDLKLELVPVPVFDIDPAKAFYVKKVGFNADHDVQPGNGMRVLQLTPPGSACSIVSDLDWEKFLR